MSRRSRRGVLTGGGSETFGYTSSSKLQPDGCAIIARDGHPNRSHVIRFGKTILLGMFMAVAIAACGRQHNIADAGPEKLYEQGKKAMDGSNYAGAIQYFTALGSRYPFSPEARQSQLDMIYLHYKNQQPEE